MTICVDVLRMHKPKSKTVAKHGNYWCHLFSDNDQESELLHDFAAQLGLKGEYFQEHRLLPHYDLTPNKRTKAIALGAVEKDTVEIIREKLTKQKQSQEDTQCK